MQKGNTSNTRVQISPPTPFSSTPEVELCINMSVVTHRHHIIPKHRGGSDDESNLIELSISDHAEAHRILYEKYGNWEDYVAWQGLSGQIGKAEITRQIQSNAAKERLKIKGNPWAGVKGGGNFELHPEIQRRATRLAASEEANAKRKATFAKMKHSQGVNNSQFGSCWITDGKTSKKISKTEMVPEGWHLGRVL